MTARIDRRFGGASVLYRQRHRVGHALNIDRQRQGDRRRGTGNDAQGIHRHRRDVQGEIGIAVVRRRDGQGDG